MIVVADTTPLLYLSRIGKLELLNALYRQVFVPATVWHEAVAARPSAPGVERLLAASWIIVSDRAERIGLERDLQEALDPGEAAAIALRWAASSPAVADRRTQRSCDRT